LRFSYSRIHDSNIPHWHEFNYQWNPIILRKINRMKYILLLIELLITFAWFVFHNYYYQLFFSIRLFHIIVTINYNSMLLLWYYIIGMKKKLWIYITHCTIIHNLYWTIGAIISQAWNLVIFFSSLFWWLPLYRLIIRIITTEIIFESVYNNT
jgi:hypothetical protein